MYSSWENGIVEILEVRMDGKVFYSCTKQFLGRSAKGSDVVRGCTLYDIVSSYHNNIVDYILIDPTLHLIPCERDEER